MAIYRKGRLIPDVMYGKNMHKYEMEEWWRGQNADGFSSQVNFPLMINTTRVPEISYSLLEKHFNKWWTLDLAKRLKDGYSNNRAESMHARLERLCPKGYPMGSKDWLTRLFFTGSINNDGWSVIVRTLT